MEVPIAAAVVRCHAMRTPGIRAGPRTPPPPCVVMLSTVATMIATARTSDVRCDRRVTSPAAPVCRRWTRHGRRRGCGTRQALDAIRRDLPRPTVHARNLFHMSAAMWDAWATYDPVAQGYFTTEKLHAHRTSRPPAARPSATRRTGSSPSATRPRRAQPTASRSSTRRWPRSATTSRSRPPRATRPAALGNRIAATAIAFGLTDGSNEQNNYAAPTTYAPVNKPLIVTEPGTKMKDPNRWQPLALDKQEAQNGIFIPGKVQKSVTPFWGHVTSFGLPASADGTPVDAGTPPRIEDAPLKKGRAQPVQG